MHVIPGAVPCLSMASLMRCGDTQATELRLTHPLFKVLDLVGSGQGFGMGPSGTLRSTSQTPPSSPATHSTVLVTSWKQVVPRCGLSYPVARQHQCHVQRCLVSMELKREVSPAKMESNITSWEKNIIGRHTHTKPDLNIYEFPESGKVMLNEWTAKDVSRFWTRRDYESWNLSALGKLTEDIDKLKDVKG